MSTRPKNDFGALDLTAGLGSDQYLTFILAGEEYGVNILRVQEIKGWTGVTEIPNTPDYVQGVVNLRGTIVPIVDLRRCFGIKTVDYDKTTVIIMLKVTAQRGERTMGFVVDAVSDVYDVSAEQRRPAPDFGSAAQAGFVTGLATVAEKMVILLDIDRLVETRMGPQDQKPGDIAQDVPVLEVPKGNI